MELELFRLALASLRGEVYVTSLAALALGSALTIAAVEVMLAAQAAGQPGRASHSDVLAAAAGNYLLGLMTVIVAFMTVCVVASGMSFVVALRRRELGLLRAVGATPGQVKRLVLCEAVVLALVGGATGAIVAPVVARIFVAWLSARRMVPAHLHLAFRPAAVPIGGLFMLLVAVTAAWPSARRCARLAPVEALRQADLDRGAMTGARWLCALPCLVLASYLMSRIARGGMQGELAVSFTEAALIVVGLTLLAPVVIPRVTALALLPGRRLTVGRVAGYSSRRAVRRTAALATPVMLVVAITAALGTVIDSVQATVHVHVADPTDSSNMNPAFLAMVVTIMVIYASVSLAGTASLATTARARELIALRFAGATRIQAIAVVALEVLAVVLVAGGLAIGSLLVGSLGGHTAGRVIPWTLLVVVTGICAVVPIVAAILATAQGSAGSDALTAAGGA